MPTTGRPRAVWRCLPWLMLIACANPEATESISATVPVPVFDIVGTSDSGAAFMDVNDATMLADGSIVAADPELNRLVVLDTAGRVVRTIGRPGDGPGEFRMVAAVEQCLPDTLFVWDRGHSGVTVLSASGDFVRQFRLPEAPFRVSCNRAGTLLLMMRPTEAAAATGSATTLRARTVLMNALGDSIGTLGEIDAGENRLLGPQTRLLAGADVYVIGTGVEPSFELIDPSSMQRRVITFDLAVRPPTQAMYELVVDRQLEAMGPSPVNAQLRERMLAMPMPERLPAYREAFMTPAGVLWALSSFPGDTTTTLHGMTTDGADAGTLVLPHELEVFEVGTNHLVGRYLDQESVPHLVSYRLPAAAAAP